MFIKILAIFFENLPYPVRFSHFDSSIYLWYGYAYDTLRGRIITYHLNQLKKFDPNARLLECIDELKRRRNEAQRCGISSGDEAYPVLLEILLKSK